MKKDTILPFGEGVNLYQSGTVNVDIRCLDDAARTSAVDLWGTGMNIHFATEPLSCNRFELTLGLGVLALGLHASVLEPSNVMKLQSTALWLY